MHYDDSFYTNSLYHHGILGQKWGVRRFQNKDGSLTSEGKTRYNDSNEKNNKIKKGLKIAAGVGIAAIGAYAAYKVGKAYFNSNVSGTLANKLINSLNTSTKEHGKERVQHLLESPKHDIMNRAPKVAKPKSVPKKLSDFAFKQVARVDSNGKKSSIALPVDKKGYAEAFAREMASKNGKANDYQYWYNYIMNRMAHQ